MNETDLRLDRNKRYYDLFLENVKARSDARDYSYLLKRFMELLPESSYILKSFQVKGS